MIPRALLVLGLVATLMLGACGGDAPKPRPGPGLFAYDASRPLGVIEAGKPAVRDGVRAQRFSYAGTDGQRVPAVLALPRGASTAAPVPCLIYQGGFESGKEEAAALWPAAAKLQIGVMTIDPRGEGTRAGDGSELARALRDPEAFTRLLRGSVLDLRRALDYLGRQPECDPSRLGVVGFSQGGLLGTLLAGADTRVRAVALLGAGAGWAQIIGRPDSLILPDRTGERLQSALRILRPYEPASWVRRISPRPVLFVQGTHDETTSAAQAANLQRAAREPKEVVTYDGPHDPFGNAEAVDGLVSFLRDELIAAP